MATAQNYSMMSEEPEGMGTDPAADDASSHRKEFRFWLHLLACTTLIETEIRRQFREEFNFTLARFEVLAQLEREPGGLVLGELPKRLMVTAGSSDSDHRSSGCGRVSSRARRQRLIDAYKLFA